MCSFFLDMHFHSNFRTSLKCLYFKTFCIKVSLSFNSFLCKVVELPIGSEQLSDAAQKLRQHHHLQLKKNLR